VTIRTVRADIDVNVFMKGLVGPIFTPKEHEFCRVRFGPPNITELGLQTSQGYSLGQTLTGKQLDEWHGGFGVV
jgi:hypothetical protein